jgi:hypothetical protein
VITCSLLVTDHEPSESVPSCPLSGSSSATVGSDCRSVPLCRITDPHTSLGERIGDLSLTEIQTNFMGILLLVVLATHVVLHWVSIRTTREPF